MSIHCILKFDGACRGNPGNGGAGAVILNSSGHVVSRVSKNLGMTTNNVAEYEGLIAGLETAIDMGFKVVHAMGDSQIVCKQVNGSWAVRSTDLLEPLRRVKELINFLDEFYIIHISMDDNTEADAAANMGITD